MSDSLISEYGAYASRPNVATEMIHFSGVCSKILLVTVTVR